MDNRINSGTQNSKPALQNCQQDNISCNREEGSSRTPHPQDTFDLSPFKHLYPFRNNWFEVRLGIFMHYVDEGQGDPIIMLHGNPTWSFYYRELIRHFSKTHRVIAPDHIGMGLSDKPPEDKYCYRLKNHIEDLDALLRYLNIEKKAVLVLHDWGGPIGLGWALKNLQKVSKVVLLNTAGFLMPSEKKLPWQLALIKYLPIISDILVRLFNIFVFVATFVGLCSRMRWDVRKAYLAPFNSWKNRISQLRFVQDIPVSSRDPSYPVLKWIDENLHLLKGKPMLIQWGMKDFVLDKIILKEWIRRFPDALVYEFKTAGHFVLEDVPREIIRNMEEFFAKDR